MICGEFSEKNRKLGMKKIEFAKTSKNESALLDIFQRAKRAGKIFHLGFSEKNTGPYISVGAHGLQVNGFQSLPVGSP